MALSVAAQNALNLARQISQQPDPALRAPLVDQYLGQLRAMQSEEMTEVIANLASYDTNPGAVSKALREAAIVASEARNAAALVHATQRFDEKAFWLTLMLIVLSVVGLLVAFIPDKAKEPIWQAIIGLFHKG